MKHYFSIIILLIFIVSCGSENQNNCICNYNTDKYSPIQGLSVYTQLEPGIECAQNCDKPIFLWFTGWQLSARKMEEKILAHRTNFKKLKNDFVVVSLYVDDDVPLAQEEVETWNHFGRERKIDTYGKKNAKFQAERFKGNSQPMFVILSPDGEDVIDQFGYLPDIWKVDSILTGALNSYKD